MRSITLTPLESLSSAGLRLVQLNLAFDPACRDPEQLLERYHTLTGWSRALTSAGAEVRVVQRFSRDATVVREGVVYELVGDPLAARLPPWTVSPQVIARIARHPPDVVHVNGLMFPGMVGATRASADPACVVVAQDHSGGLPKPGVWRSLQSLLPFAGAQLDPAHDRAQWSSGLRHLDACTFTSRELASPWHALGLPVTVPIIEIPEASTMLSPIDRDRARSTTGIFGAPAVLWVGRLDANKDPLTVLAGFDRALAGLPGGRLWMIIPSHADDTQVRRRIESSPALRGRVSILGAIDYPEMPASYSAADVFVSGSHHEGSGYALIEAMACGVGPCVTDIAAFRALTGRCGVLWRAGDVSAMAAALQEAAGRDIDAWRRQVRQRFDDVLSWPAVGQRTFDKYAGLVERRRAAAAR